MKLEELSKLRAELQLDPNPSSTARKILVELDSLEKINPSILDPNYIVSGDRNYCPCCGRPWSKESLNE